MLTADFSKIKQLRLDSGKILVEKVRRIKLPTTSYNESDILHYFCAKDPFPFRNDEFQAHLQSQIGVLQIPETFQITAGLQWVND